MLSAELVKLCLALCSLATFVVFWVNRGRKARDAGGKVGDDQFQRFQRTYLAVYLTAMMADWLQGPYVYALYESYGFSRGDNAMLFTAGFGSSALFGTFVGALADTHGRRKAASLYCLLYIVSCCTKHFNSFPLLLLGRVTGGIATSLLASVFDSWLVSEHNRRRFDPELLENTFTLAVFGNGLVAVVAGEIGQVAADLRELTPLGGGFHIGGYCTPFDVAIAFLVVSGVMLSLTWPENYGHGSGSSAGTSSLGLSHALDTIMRQPKVLYCGLVCAMFEASMFIFVFQWTTALTEEGAAKPPYGHIFATFMVMSMLGSQLFSLACSWMPIESVGVFTLGFAAACHSVPVLSDSTFARFISFLLFEMSVGLYFPMMGTLKARLVPEESRAAIYNLFRVPLNIIVLGALVTKVELGTAFSVTTVMLIGGACMQTRLMLSMQGSSNAGYAQVGQDVELELGYAQVRRELELGERDHDFD